MFYLAFRVLNVILYLKGLTFFLTGVWTNSPDASDIGRLSLLILKSSQTELSLGMDRDGHNQEIGSHYYGR